MDYEKKYKEALERARQFSEHPLQEDSDSIVEYIFPELKESNDEKIRKAIHIYLDWLDGRNKDYQPKGDYSIKDMIAWIEKQGKQKPTDKIKPKFKVGDWLVEPRFGEPNGLWHVKRIEVNNYWDGLNGVRIEHADKYYHLWTIQDAKDGDVLFVKPTENLGGQLIIFGGIDSDSRIKYYCRFLNNKFSINDGLTGYDHKYFLPATEEQRETIFAKMHEAGYMWDSESKQLLSLKAEPSVELEPAWSEKDEQHIDSLLKRLDGLCRNEFERTRFAISEDRDWLTSLKERIE